MTPYIIFYFFTFTIIILNVLKYRKVNFFFIVIISILFCGFRSLNVGPDTEAYYKYFINPEYGYGLIGVKQEIGLVWFNKILHLLIPNQYYVFFVSIISLAGVYYSVYKLSLNKSLSVYLFLILGIQTIFFHAFFFLIRQCLATSFFMIGVTIFILGNENIKKKLIGGIFIFISILFHSSVVLAILMFLLANLTRFKKNTWYLIIIFSYFLGYFNLSIIFKQFYGILNQVNYLNRFAYATNFDNISMFASSGGILKMLSAPFSIICLFLIKKAHPQTMKNTLLIFVLLGIILNNIFWANLMICRLLIYQVIFLIIIIPNIIVFRGKNVLFYSLLFLYFNYKTFSELEAQSSIKDSSDIKSLVPYTSIFN